MDYRLDLINAVKNFNDNATDDDVLMVIQHNKKDSDLFTCFTGDWEILSAALNTEGYINFKEGDMESFEIMQKSVLNIAFNICKSNKFLAQKFKLAL